MLLYQRKEEIVEATKMTCQIDLPVGVAKPGDWLVIGADGKLQFFSESEFFSVFEPCADDSAQPTRFRRQRRAARGRKNGLEELLDEALRLKGGLLDETLKLKSED